jgi:hypothetical protein
MEQLPSALIACCLMYSMGAASAQTVPNPFEGTFERSDPKPPANNTHSSPGIAPTKPAAAQTGANPFEGAIRNDQPKRAAPENLPDIPSTAPIIKLPKKATDLGIEFHIRNSSPYGIHVRFYSQNRAVSWPGQGKAWLQTDNTMHDYNLSCIPGEEICYGAWTIPNHAHNWGVGDDGKHRCTSCCAVCGSDVEAMELGLPRPTTRLTKSPQNTKPALTMEDRQAKCLEERYSSCKDDYDSYVRICRLESDETVGDSTDRGNSYRECLKVWRDDDTSGKCESAADFICSRVR